MSIIKPDPSEKCYACGAPATTYSHTFPLCQRCFQREHELIPLLEALASFDYWLSLAEADLVKSTKVEEVRDIRQRLKALIEDIARGGD